MYVVTALPDAPPALGILRFYLAMKIQSFLALYIFAAASVAALTPTTSAPARDKNAGVCSEDADCEKYPGTVCVQITSGDYTAGKCTPNYGQKPVCRGGQSGLCPQYQDPTQGYLNTQCVLVDKSMQGATDTDAGVPVNVATTTAAPAGPGTDTTTPTDSTTPATAPKTTASTSPTTDTTSAPATPATTKKSTGTTAAPPQPPVVPGARLLAAMASSAGNASNTTAAPVTDAPTDDTSSSSSGSGTSSSSSSADDITPVKAQACPSDKTLSLDSPKCWFNTVYGNRTILAQYRCVDYSMCMEQSAASQAALQSDKESYCRPKKCVTGERQLCNNRGTCQSNDIFQPMRPEGYSCRCYAGYTGQNCEKTTGGTCDVDCGVGGACINRQCVCYAAYAGKDVRCSKCVKNAACENNNTCNVDTGKCECKEGYIGLTCGGKVDNCAGVKCSDGGAPYDAGTVCKCKCTKCKGTACPDCKGTDCSTTTGGCPAVVLAEGTATSLVLSAVAVVAAVLVMVA
ncbi:unnamed protein product [Aphanomyces euteiches]